MSVSLRMEGDESQVLLPVMPKHFPSLPPYGGRRITEGTGAFRSDRKGSPSVWRETNHSPPSLGVDS